MLGNDRADALGKTITQ